MYKRGARAIKFTGEHGAIVALVAIALWSSFSAWLAFLLFSGGIALGSAAG